MAPQEDHPGGGVWVPTGQIYDKLLVVESKLDRLLEHDLPTRMRTVEIRTWGIIPALTSGLLGLAAALTRV